MNGSISNRMRNQTSENEHETIAELLPWLINDRLSVEESARVDAHLQHCEKCRSQINHLQAVNKHLAEEETVWKPSSAHFSSILSALDRIEAASPKEAKTQISLAGLFKGLLQTPSPIRWALALESVAIVTLLTVVNSSPQKNSHPDLYQTLSDSPKETPTPAMTRIRLLLSETMTIAELTQLLQQTDTQFRHGPSALGLFIVEVSQDKTVQILRILKNHQGIRLAQPLEVTP